MGTIGVFSKLTGLPAEIITFFRLFFGALFMALFLLATGKKQCILQRPHFSLLVNGGFLAGFIIFYVQSMNFTSMANAIMLIYLAPVVASVYAHFFLGERLNLLSTLLIGVALFGFGLMMEFDATIAQDKREVVGIGLGILALSCYAGFILVNRVIPESIHPFTSTYYQLLSGAAVMLPLCLASFIQVRPEHAVWLLAIGFFPGFLAILMAVLALRVLPAATFGTIAYVEPVTVVIFGWVLFQETLSPMQLCGCILIMASGVVKSYLPEESRIR
jgi:drug/metabolite transporter (DMT)-like permease